MPKQPWKNYFDCGSRQKQRRLDDSQHEHSSSADSNFFEVAPTLHVETLEGDFSYNDDQSQEGRTHGETDPLNSSLSSSSADVDPTDPSFPEDPGVDESIDFRFFDDPDENDIEAHSRNFWGIDDDEFQEYENVFSLEAFCQKLRIICLEGTIAQATLSRILALLKKEVPLLNGIHKDARTLLKTPVNTKSQLIPMSPGKYYHIGIQKSLENIFSHYQPAIWPPSIKLSCNFDGLPLFKSPRSEFWPILCRICNIPALARHVFVIGLYYGPKKPHDFNAYLKPFVDEFNHLYTDGMTLNGTYMHIEIESMPLDAPAKASILGIKNFNGHSSCTKCKVEGFTVDHRTFFPALHAFPRTHEEFIAQTDEDFHNRESYIAKLKGVDLVDVVPLDYQHLVCLGLVKKLIGFWIVCPQKDKKYKLTGQEINEINKRLRDITNSRSNACDFARPPRGLDEVGNWKAVEFREFLLYTGPSVLKGIVKDEVYENFMLLHTAVSIMVCPKLCTEENLDIAENLCKKFVVTYRQLYGKHFMSHNVHNLLHLPRCCRKFGPLDEFCCYPFENKLGWIKNLIAKGSQPLQQAVNRLEEGSCLPPKLVDTDPPQLLATFPWKGVALELPTESYEGYSQYRALKCSLFTINCARPGDSVCGLNDGTLVVVETILLNEESSAMIVGRTLRGQSEAYQKPFASGQLGTHFFERKSRRQKMWPVEMISCKYYVIFRDSVFHVTPLRHSFMWKWLDTFNFSFLRSNPSFHK